MKQLLIGGTVLLSSLACRAQAPANSPGSAGNVEIAFSRERARPFFGTYEFEPRFQMRIFSENGKLFAQRLGDPDRFQLFAKKPTVFFLKAMPAELEFLPTATGQYETLVLHMGGHDQKARRLKAQPFELYDQLAQLDSLVYEAYNHQQLAAFMAYFSPQLEFYYDQTGLTTYQDNFQRFKENFAKPTPLRRELVPGSLEVYPINKFGAIELGVHRFYQPQPGQPDKLVGEPRFMQVWQNVDGKWQITRVISYDH